MLHADKKDHHNIIIVLYVMMNDDDDRLWRTRKQRNILQSFYKKASEQYFFISCLHVRIFYAPSLLCSRAKKTIIFACRNVGTEDEWTRDNREETSSMPSTSSDPTLIYQPVVTKERAIEIATVDGHRFDGWHRFRYRNRNRLSIILAVWMVISLLLLFAS